MLGVVDGAGALELPLDGEGVVLVVPVGVAVRVLVDVAVALAPEGRAEEVPVAVGLLVPELVPVAVPVDVGSTVRVDVGVDDRLTTALVLAEPVVLGVSVGEGDMLPDVAVGVAVGVAVDVALREGATRVTDAVLLGETLALKEGSIVAFVPFHTHSLGVGVGVNRPVPFVKAPGVGNTTSDTFRERTCKLAYASAMSMGRKSVPKKPRYLRGTEREGGRR